MNFQNMLVIRDFHTSGTFYKASKLSNFEKIEVFWKIATTWFAHTTHTFFTLNICCDFWKNFNFTKLRRFVECVWRVQIMHYENFCAWCVQTMPNTKTLFRTNYAWRKKCVRSRKSVKCAVFVEKSATCEVFIIS